MIADALSATEQIFTAPFRTVFVKALGLTLLCLALCGVGLEKLIVAYVLLPHAVWLATMIHAVAALGLFVVLFVLVTPVSFVVASFFFDELADHVEAAVAGAQGRGRPMPVARSIWIGLRFGLLSLIVNLAALVLLLVPGLHLIAFFGANAYLLGRGFFELAALRYCTVGETQALLRRHMPRILLAGAFCAALAAVPVVNLLTPLFATALMVRVAQPLVRRRSLGQRAV